MTRVHGTVLALAIATTLTVASPMRCQNPPARDTAGMMAGMQAMQGMMGPMMAQMASSMLNATLAVLAEPESAERLATFTKNYFDALMRRGFTREEALRIVSSVGLPASPGPPR